MSKPEQTVTQHTECMREQYSRGRGPFYDGCKRFVPAGAPGTIDGATCATCVCAKSYHRKVKVKVSVAAGEGNTCTVTVCKGSSHRGAAIASAQQVGGSLGATPTPHPSPFHGSSSPRGDHQPQCCQIL